MKLFKCSTCDKILEEKFIDKHPASAITWLDATEHEERKKKVEEIEGANEDEIKKQKVLDELKNALRKLTSEELDEEKEKLRDEIAKLRAQLEELNPEDKDKDTKQERDSRLEQIGYDSSLITKSSYSVLALEPYYDNKVSGDELFIKLGSTGSQTKGNTKADKFLQSLGSTD